MLHHLSGGIQQLCCGGTGIIGCENGRYHGNTVHSAAGKLGNVGSVDAADGYHGNANRALDLLQLLQRKIAGTPM